MKFLGFQLAKNKASMTLLYYVVSYIFLTSVSCLTHANHSS